MRLTHARSRDVEEVLAALHGDRRLTELVSAMALELERIHNDNAQLRAAVKIYREVVRQYEAGTRPHSRKAG